MRCMVECGDEYHIFATLADARAWAREAVKVVGEDAEIYRMEADGSMGDYYDDIRVKDVLGSEELDIRYMMREWGYTREEAVEGLKDGLQEYISTERRERALAALNRAEE